MPEIQTEPMSQPTLQLVAHRGCPSQFPENSLLGVDYALRCGAGWIEVDIQLAADGTPLLCHDATLNRSSRLDQSVMQSTLSELQKHGAAFNKRFGTRFRGVPFATLEQLCVVIRAHNERVTDDDGVKMFVELKGESGLHFGHQYFLDQVTAVLMQHAEATDIAALISIDEVICQLTRPGPYACGWVISRWDAESMRFAEALAPQFLFCNVKRFPKSRSDIWPGPWRWVIYTIDDPNTAETVGDLGVEFVETDCIDLFYR